MSKMKKIPTEFKLGIIVVPYIEIFDEIVAISKDGTQLIIDTYFDDLSMDSIPEKYYFDWGFGDTGYLLTVINYLYQSSKAKTKQGFSKLFAEALPSLIDHKTGLIKKPEINPADLDEFNSALLKCR